MNGLETTVILGLAVLFGIVVAPRIRIPEPLLFLAVGLLLGFVPGVQDIEMPPDAVLLVFLPVILFWESLTTSVRAIKREFRGIVIRSTVLVLVTALGAAWVAWNLGVPWAAALVLGAALAPPDATAAAALGKDLPRRQFMTLKAESLTNDGTALVLYGVAVGIAVGGQYTAWSITGITLVSYVGGVAIGLATAGLGYLLMSRVSDTTVLNIALLLVPFVAYLGAELIGASGVLSVVAAGLIVTTFAGRMSTAASRRMAESVWPLGTTILNGALFVLIGLEVQAVFRDMTDVSLVQVAILVVAVSVVLIVVRYVGIQVSVWFIRLVDRRASQEGRRTTPRSVVVTSFTGFRGAVSLAIALSVPLTTDDGSPFPFRNEVILVTAGVIVVLMVVQGAVLPALIRWNAGEVPKGDDLALPEATRSLLADGRRYLPEAARELAVSDETETRVRRELEDLWQTSGDPMEEEGDPPEFSTLMLEVLAHERSVLEGMRTQGRVSEEVFRRLRATLDLEEVRTRGLEKFD